MAISSIGNKISSVKFTSRGADEESSNVRDKAVAFVNLDDQQVRRLAYLSSVDKKGDKKNRQSALSMLYALPIVAGLSRGILKEGKLSTKAFAASKTAGGWVAGLMALGAYNMIKKAVISDSKTVKNFEANNPVASMVIDVGIFAGVLALGTKNAGKLRAKIAKVAPKLVKNVISKLITAKTFLDKTKLNKEILPKVTKHVASLAEKAPWATGASRFVLRNSVLVLLFAGILKSSSDSKQKQERIVNNYKQIKEAQYQIAKRLASETSEANEAGESNENTEVSSDSAEDN